MNLFGETETTKQEDDLKAEFDRFRKLYPKPKCGLDTEWDFFKKSTKNRGVDYKQIVPLLCDAVKRQILWRYQAKQVKEFTPNWKSFQAWINNKTWELEVPIKEDAPTCPPELRSIMNPVLKATKVPTMWDKFDSFEQDKKRALIDGAIETLIKNNQGTERCFRNRMRNPKVRDKVFENMQGEK
jgi:hypothetical protein